jgi:hypothetical protein
MLTTSPIKSLLEAAQMVEENGGGRNKVPSSDFDIVYDVGFQQPLSSSSPDIAALQEIHPPLVRVASAASSAQVLPEEEGEEVEEPTFAAPGPERISFSSDDEDEDEDEEKSTTYVLPEDTPLPALFDEDDIPFINPSHYIIGTEILEAFVVKKYDVAAPLKKTQKMKPNFRAGSVAFRCRYCKHAQHKKPNSTLYPESLGGLYRANLRFQSNHVSNCLLIPHWLRLKLHRTRRNSNVGRQRLDQIGIRDYWVETAARKGFKNAEGKKRLTFSLPY